eukprot:m.294635 g.294635  ORF g.294635 m.294635 type:complete len:616 (+) comp40752_c0_seq9:960-2807(+)
MVADSVPRAQVQRQPATLPNNPFVMTFSQLEKFIEDINQTSKCTTEGCDGKLIAVRARTIGLGGAADVVFNCSLCPNRPMLLRSSSRLHSSRQTSVGLALAFGFFISGHGYASYERTLRQHIGFEVLSNKAYYKIIAKAHPHIQAILDDLCAKEKNRMQAMPPEEIGSWQRAVVASDGVWLTRGAHSKHGSFVVKNFLTGAILWYDHLSQKKAGKIEDEAYKGTSKSMEGYMASRTYQKAKTEGCNIEVLWQDGDATTEKAFNDVGFANSRVMLCAGHVNRSHGHSLDEASKKKAFSADFIKEHQGDFPAVAEVKCNCEKKRHSPSCGCIRDAFVRNAKVNHFACILQAEKNPEVYATTMTTLGKYNARDIHSWEGGQCRFHEQEIRPGQPYRTKFPLTCPLHALAYEIECAHRAGMAEKIIHPEFGKGHSNLCEATFNVLPKFRAKDSNIGMLRYQASTNLGLIHANSTYMFKFVDQGFSWVEELYGRMNLPIVDTAHRACAKARKKRAKALEKQQTEESKQQRIMQKRARQEDQAARREWSKKQKVVHTYGPEEEQDEEVTKKRGNGSQIRKPAKRLRLNAEEEQPSLRRACKCGSTTHLRTTETANFVKYDC